MHTLMTARVCVCICVCARARVCVCVCIILVWLFHKAPVRSVIDSLSGAAERLGPVNLFSHTLHPYLWAPAVLSITADQTYCVIVLAQAREPRVSGRSPLNIPISPYYFINSHADQKGWGRGRWRERCQWRPWWEVKLPEPGRYASTFWSGSN